jgi:glyoxylase-like metal-dependent hydrolase (beta-lactamase superfamily II)
VSVQTQPRPARLPLPGGRDGATVRVWPLLTGEMLAPPDFCERPSGPLGVPRGFLARRSRWRWVPIPAFLVEHPGAGRILVDTGLHPSVAHDPAENLGRLNHALLTFRVEQGQAVSAQLRAMGTEPGEIGLVVMTHLHYDHASAVVEFPDATFVVDRREWHAVSNGGTAKGYRARLVDHAFDWRTLDFDDDAVDSFATFGRAIDLLGDGSIRLLSTPGHTAGHVSVLLRLEGRELLLTADAAYARRTIDEQLLPLIVGDEHLYRRSLKEIRGYVERTPDAVVVCGHDPDEWARLPPGPLS